MRSGFPRLAGRLTPTYAAVALLAVAGTAGFAVRSIEASLVTRVEHGLHDQAAAAAAALEAPNSIPPSTYCAPFGARSETRLTIIAEDGTVICDSDATAERMDNHAGRREVRAAFETGQGRDIRYSRSTLQDLIYVAVRAAAPTGEAFVVRVATSLDDVEAAIAAVRLRVVLAAVLSLAAAVLLGVLVTRRLGRHLSAIEHAAGEISAGSRLPRMPAPEIAEFVTLADALDGMVRRLDAQIEAAETQRAELEAILAGMVEAVLVVDADRRLLRANPAAVRLFSLRAGEQRHRPLPELIRNPALQGVVEGILEDGRVTETEISLLDGDRVLQVHGSPLGQSGTDGPAGAIVVLHDVTRLRRLETMRRDFVANVSHELRTPITSIKGFGETLLGGALDDTAHARRFVEIIARQADRLTAIIEDLLSLARVERLEESGQLHVDDVEIGPLVERSAGNLAARAETRRVSLETSAPAGLRWGLNASLIEQALTNLVDNAVKYGKEGGRAIVRARVDDGRLHFDVIDDGPGIPREAQDRIFERFYRLDPSRSRDLGGTGLGLAIVKHIALAHGGDVAVDSRPGAGCRFTISLPPRAI